MKRQRGRALWGAAAVASAAFLLYHSTLLPGLDFGDTASFQTVAGSDIVSPRDGYPLYFAIARAAIPIIGGDPAHALNLTTALESAAACGMLTLLATELSGSVLAAIAAALLFAVSYTFWSQSVITEVYGLHALCVCLSLWLLLRWAERPTLTRLAVFFAAYALGFGNHLSMILLLPAFTFFLLASAPGGWRSMLRPRVIALAILMAAAGALQYAWNLRTLWYGPAPPDGLVAGIVSAWFDITKSDWRDTMVMNVPRVMLSDHAAMYLFDVRQQFGWAGIAAASIGLGVLWRLNWRRGVLVAGVYAANLVFAYGYNVGDTHVFYLPSHLMLALLIAPALVGLSRAARHPHAQTCAALLGIAYAGARMYADYPALDRRDDRRPTETLARLTAGLDDRRSILLTDLNWQVQNGLGYVETRLHAGPASARLAEVLLYAPALVQDNAAIGRDVVATARAAATLSRAFGPMVRTETDPGGPGEALADLTGGLAEGTAYVLCVLKPTRDFTLDAVAVAHAVADLTGGQLTSVPAGDYVAIGGLAGRPPAIVAASSSPFRRTADIGGTRVEIRMESWLAADTIRRMGFGHVIANRRHSLIVERGVSFVAFDRTGAPLRSGYAAGIFGVEPRYLCYRWIG